MITTKLEEILEAAAEAAAKGLRVALPGKVLRYDAATQTADVALSVRHRLNETDDAEEEWETYPTLTAIPIKFPRTATWILSFPIAEGDRVEVRFADVNLSGWRAGGEDTTDPEAHGIAGAFATPGLYPDGEAWAGVSTTAAVLEHATGGRVAVTAAGVELGRGAGLAPLPTLASVNAALAAVLAYAASIPGAPPPPPAVAASGTTAVTAK
jgi:hypothetical protein